MDLLKNIIESVENKKYSFIALENEIAEMTRVTDEYLIEFVFDLSDYTLSERFEELYEGEPPLLTNPVNDKIPTLNNPVPKKNKKLRGVEHPPRIGDAVQAFYRGNPTTFLIQKIDKNNNIVNLQSPKLNASITMELSRLKVSEPSKEYTRGQANEMLVPRPVVDIKYDDEYIRVFVPLAKTSKQTTRNQSGNLTNTHSAKTQSQIEKAGRNRSPKTGKNGGYIKKNKMSFT